MQFHCLHSPQYLTSLYRQLLMRHHHRQRTYLGMNQMRQRLRCFLVRDLWMGYYPFLRRRLCSLRHHQNRHFHRKRRLRLRRRNRRPQQLL